MQVELSFGHGAHRDEIGINDRYLHDSIEAIDPQVSLFRRRCKQHETACMRFQLKAIAPRRLFPIDLSLCLDPLNTDNFTLQYRLIFLRHRLLLYLHKVLFG